MAHAIGQFTERIGRAGVDQIHGDHHQRDQRQRRAALLRLQHQERFAEARQREDGADTHHPPIAAPQQPQIGAGDRVGALVGYRGGRLFQAKKQQRNQRRRDRRHPKDGAKIVVPQQHQADGQQRP